MFARVYSGGLLGVDAYRIEVEVACGSGMGQIHIVGLPDAAVQESAERVRAAIKACEFALSPGHKWVVNLAPGDLRKAGPIYDLPIAAGILASSQLINGDHLSSFWIAGELGLDGMVRPIAGVLPLAFACKQSGACAIIVPESNAHEASLVEGLTVYPVNHLRQVCSILCDPKLVPSLPPQLHQAQKRCATEDFCEVKGQGRAKHALEIAAAGHHNVLLVGPPGAGKSMLAQRLPGIMPPLEFHEALELTKLYSITGKLQAAGAALATERPFRAPHHTSSTAGLIGGGSIPRPGEISLSHHGVLFLDELTEFPRRHLDTLRQPLETGNVTISRSQQTLSYPASFLFVAACNPCPCGYRGDPAKPCTCAPTQAQRYWSRLSGPLLDRIDLCVEVKRLTEDELASSLAAESSESIRQRVLNAVEKQKQRTANSSMQYNGQLQGKQLLDFCKIDDSVRKRLANSVTAMALSARAFDRTLRVARTITDLRGQEKVTWNDVRDALNYRMLRISDFNRPSVDR